MEQATRRKVLVVGLGLSGMSAALRLKDAGWDATVVERAPERRVGGYFIGLFEAGRDAARRLGVLDVMVERTPEVSRAWEVDDRGDRRRSTGFLDQREEVAAVLRGDIEAALWTRVEEEVDVRFSTTPVDISTTEATARVTLLDTSTGKRTEETYDLVVGADGLRSTVRRMAFGPDEKYVKPMNAMICSFTMTEQVPHFAPEDALTVVEPGRSLWVLPMGGRAPAALLTYRTDDYDAQFTRPPVEVLREKFAGLSGDGAVEHVLDQLEKAPDFLFDSVSQVRMPSWHRGRVVVLGDAAWCVSLYSGYGASAGMMGAVALGDAIAASPGSIPEALDAWESAVRPKVRKYAIGAHVKGQVFTPSNKLTLRLRELVLERETKKLIAAAAVPAA